VPLDDRNLVWRAADALWRAAGRRGAPSGAVVHLTKRIPAQGGLGGGSSDAAAALVALDALWGCGLPPEALQPLAASIGADVPFFLAGGTALGTGRGDTIRPLPDLPHHEVMLLLPSFGVSTKEAFGWWDARHPGAAVDAGAAAPVESPDRVASGPVVNDLEAAVAACHPELARMTTALREAGATAAAMTGTGSTVFGLFDSRQAADAAAARLRPGGWRIVLTRFANAAARARARRVPGRRRHELHRL
jgi:4-diphosphocytidyl-2-C-methyl-D-erythritol kinase